MYHARLAQRQQQTDAALRLVDRLGLWRVLVFLLGLGVAYASLAEELLHPFWLILPGVAFLVLLIRYDLMNRRLYRAQRAVRFYDQGLARLAGRWPEAADAGERFRDPRHLFADDLDLFGPGSLFQRLSIARTGPGEALLADWLKKPAPDVGELRSRQQAVAELRPRLDLREDLALLGAELPAIDFEPLARWGTASPLLTSTAVRRTLAILGGFNVVLLIVGLATSLTLLPFTVTLLISVLIAWRLRDQTRAVLAPVERMGEHLGLLAELLRRIEQEPFASEPLRQLRKALDVEGDPPSAQIAGLVGLIDWLNARRNQMFMPIALVTCWPTQMAMAFEGWRRRCGRSIASWLDAVARFEALGSLAAYAFENPADPFPEIVEGFPCVEAVGLGHPLLPVEHCVRNDVSLGEQTRLLIVSGSNMSGKSTLLRAIGANLVLAFAGAPVRADSLRLTLLTLGATLRVQDSLLESRSRFYAEITRLREILDATCGRRPVLFLLDELFHGTNSHDRGLGAEAVLGRLLERGAIGLVTTHDLSLTTLPDRLGATVGNVHFVEDVQEGTLHFDYRMRPGVVPHGNGLALMRVVGLDV